MGRGGRPGREEGEEEMDRGRGERKRRDRRREGKEENGEKEIGKEGTGVKAHKFLLLLNYTTDQTSEL